MKISDSAIAVRSDSIVEARYSLTAKQNDLLDMVLCEIKDDDKYQYEISVEKYASFYKTDTSNLYRDMEKAANSIEGKGFHLFVKDNKDRINKIYFNWFSSIHYLQKEGKIKFNLDIDFKKILWEVKKKIYYDIQYPLNFNSNYSKRLYYYLKSFEDTGFRIDKIEDLLFKLECPDTYKNFALFKQRVLEISTREINSSSDLFFNYKPIKEGRKVARVQFNVFKKDDNGNILIGKTEDSTDIMLQLISEIRKIIEEPISDEEIKVLLMHSKNDVNIIKEKYTIMKQQKRVRNIVAWLKKAIKEDFKPNRDMEAPKGKTKKQGNFNNFEQRDCDYVQLETDLTAWQRQ